MANKINFITGETYTLAELFSGERRIIIPDLQRDYCWGDEVNVKSTGEIGELVSDFIKNLIEQYNEQKKNDDQGTLNLGMFYGYEVPKNHIQLCDGQQRLTTLYLLLGMLNKQTGKIRHHLISDYEFKHDDKEPYLNYAIRESSLYFLRDLVCQFFIENQDKVDSIKKADWYFEDYNLDPSIQSMLNALQKIENLSKEMPDDLGKFEDWLLNKITFLYFDMETRKNGEETFVVINTTGEALSATQNLKPLVLQENANTSFKNQNGLPADKCWEEIETWFWKKRNSSANDTADAGFGEFLRWISIIELVDEPVPPEKKTKDISMLIQLILQGKECDFPYKRISFEKIYNYWKAIKWIADESKLTFVNNYLSPISNNDVNNRKAINQSECFVLLPVLKYVSQNCNDINSNVDKQLNAKRIYMFLSNLMNISNVSKNVNSLVGDAIKIIDLIKNGDIATLVDPSVNTSNVSTQILSEEEKIKLTIELNAPNRTDIEKAFWEVQKSDIWSGEILTIVKWAIDDNGIFDLNLFNKYKDKLNEIMQNGDLLRRALLTQDLNNYPFKKTETNYSFGFDGKDWKLIINNNNDKIKNFLDSITLNQTQNDMNQMITNCSSTNPWIVFISNPDLIAYCTKKNIQKWNKSYCLLKSERATTYAELKAYELYCEYKKSPSSYNGWTISFYEKEDTCLFFEKKVGNNTIEIDVYFGRMKQDDYIINFFLKAQSGEDVVALGARVHKELLAPAQSILGISSVNSNSGRFELNVLSKADVKQKVDALLSYKY